jgi:hypothetical protein
LVSTLAVARAPRDIKDRLVGCDPRWDSSTCEGTIYIKDKIVRLSKPLYYCCSRGRVIYRNVAIVGLLASLYPSLHYIIFRRAIDYGHVIIKVVDFNIVCSETITARCYECERVENGHFTWINTRASDDRPVID